MSFHSRRQSLCYHALSTTALLSSSLAWAQGRVAKQQNCAVLVQGLTSASVGQTFQINSPEGKLTGKIVKASPKSALGKIDKKEGKCPALLGAEVTTGDTSTGNSASKGNSSGGAAASSEENNSSSSGNKGNNGKSAFFGSAQVGMALLTMQKEETDNKAQQLTGLQFALVGGYKLALGHGMAVPLHGGISYFSTSAKLQYQDDIQGTTYTLEPTFSVMALRLGTGFHMGLGPIQLLSEVNYDLGLSSKLSVKMVDSTATTTVDNKISGPYRIDIAVGAGYPIGNHTIGILGAFDMGGLKRQMAATDGSGSVTTVSRSYTGLGINGYYALSF